MAKKMIQVLESSATKAEEIAWLDKVAEAAGIGTYVKSLFSEDFKI